MVNVPPSHMKWRILGLSEGQLIPQEQYVDLLKLQYTLKPVIITLLVLLQDQINKCEMWSQALLPLHRLVFVGK